MAYAITTSTDNDVVSSPHQQYKMGIPINMIQCQDDSKVLMQTPTGKPACLKQSTAEILAKRGYIEVILEKIDLDEEPTNKILHTVNQTATSKTITFDGVENNNIIPISTGTISITNVDEIFDGRGVTELGPDGHYWPKYTFTFPEQARIGEPFDIVLNYTYVIPNKDTGNYADPEKICVSIVYCNHVIKISLPTYVDHINNEGVVHVTDTEDFWHIPARKYNLTTIDPPFDNTTPLSKIFTLVINEPNIDYRYGELDISFHGTQDSMIYYHAAQNGIIYFDDELMQSLGDGPGQLRDRTGITGVLLGERIAAEPSDGPSHAFWEEFKNHMIKQWPGIKYRKFLESDPELKKSWINEFLAFYPELDDNPRGLAIGQEYSAANRMVSDTMVTNKTTQTTPLEPTNQEPKFDLFDTNNLLVQDVIEVSASSINSSLTWTVRAIDPDDDAITIAEIYTNLPDDALSLFDNQNGTASIVLVTPGLEPQNYVFVIQVSDSYDNSNEITYAVIVTP